MDDLHLALMSSGLISIPPEKGGAVEEYVFQLGKCLRSLGINANVIDLHFSRANPFPTLIQEIYSPKIPSFIPKKDLLQELIFSHYSVKKLMNFNIIHSNTAWVGFATKKLISNKLIKFVYTCHNPLWPQKEVGLSEKIIRKIEAYTMKNSNAVIAINETMKDALKKKANIPQEKLFVVPNGVDTSFFHPSNANKKKEGKYALNNEFVILFVGRVSAVKGVHVLLKSYKMLLEKHKQLAMKLLIVGPPRNRFSKISIDDYALNVMDWAHRHLPSGSYSFTGAVSREELKKLYSCADVFVLPSFAEAFGMVLLEAMSTGCPVIGSDAGGIKDVIETGVNGFLFETGSCSSLTKKIDLLVKDENLRRYMGLNSRNMAKEFYDWKLIATKMLAIYKSL